MEMPLSSSGNVPGAPGNRPPLSLSGLDFKLLRVFKAVVEAGGFSAAQNELNVGLAAISKQISDLEIRLGMRLCTRGREGFCLTEEGKLVYQASIDLFASVDSFRDRLNCVQNELIGDLSIGVIDNTLQDNSSTLIAALRTLHDEAPKVRLRLQAAPLDEIERGVVEGRLSLGIVPVYQRRDEFDYFPLYEEVSSAYCSAEHAAFTIDSSAIDVDVLRGYEVVNHRYAIHGDKANFVTLDAQSASASQVEAVAMLILTGRFIGFLPDHFAARLVRDGSMRALRPDLISIRTSIHMILRRNAPRSPVVKAFAEALKVDINTVP